MPIYRITYRQNGEWQEQYAYAHDEARRIIASLLPRKDVDTVAVDTVAAEYSPSW